MHGNESWQKFSAGSFTSMIRVEYNIRETSSKEKVLTNTQKCATM